MAHSRENDGRWFWQRYAGVYDVFMRANNRAYDRVGELIRRELSPEMDVLELATGTGMVAERVAGSCKSYLATDYSEKMLKKAQRKPFPQNTRFAQADATALPYPDASFDAVIIANALHIMPNPTAALAEIRRVLRPGGKLVAPTFTRRGNGLKDSILEKPMQWLGFRTWSNWSFAEYTAFLNEQGWCILRRDVIPAGFDIAYVVARAEG